LSGLIKNFSDARAASQLATFFEYCDLAHKLVRVAPFVVAIDAAPVIATGWNLDLLNRCQSRADVARGPSNVHDIGESFCEAVTNF
jgi:hypothetical protein